MSRITRAFTLLTISVAAGLSGCGPFPKPAVLPTQMPAGSNAVASPSPTAAILPTATALPVPTHPSVTVTAAQGNLFIRRGPDLAFNPLSVLKDGQSARAIARDVLGKWLQVPIPDHPGQTGWISIQSHFSAVSGDIAALPEIAPAEWPVLASLRNCTSHQMEADPGGILIPSLDNFPANDVQINPGIYRIYDTDVEGSPEVMKVEIQEGSAIDIRDDGDGGHRKCPVP